MKAYMKATLEIEFDSSESEACRDDPELGAEFVREWPYLEQTLRNMLGTALSDDLKWKLTVDETSASA